MAIASVQRALVQAYIDAGLELPTAYENLRFDRPNGQPWAAFRFRPNMPSLFTLGSGGSDMLTGEVEIDLNFPLYTGEAAAMEAAAKLRNYFVAGRSFIAPDGQEVRISACGQSWPRLTDSYYRLPVVISFYAMLERPPIDDSEPVVRPGIIAFVSASSSVRADALQHNITLRRTNGSDGAVAVNWTGPNGLAGVVNWDDGEEGERVITLDLTPYEEIEDDVTLTFTLTTVEGGATIGNPSQHVVTVQAVAAPQPGVIGFVLPASSAPADAGTHSIAVQRTGGSDGVVTVDWESDTQSGTLQWNDGDTANKVIEFDLTPYEDTPEDVEVLITLSNFGGGASAGPIVEHTLTVESVYVPVPGVIGFVQAASSQPNNVGAVALAVARTEGSDGAVSVSWTTDEAVPQQGELVWDDGETGEKLINLDLTLYDGLTNDVTVITTLSSPTGGATLGQSQHTLTLTVPVSAHYTSSQSGDWHDAATWGGAGVPGYGDTADISPGHTVTLSQPVKLGTGSGVALRVGTQATFNQNSSIEFRGNMEVDTGATWNQDGDILLVPGSGQRYSVRINWDQSGLTAWNVLAEGSRFCRITTDLSAGGLPGALLVNEIDLNITGGNLWLENMGDATTLGGNIYISDGYSCKFDRLVLINCGRFHINLRGGESNIDLNVDIRAHQRAGEFRLYNQDALGTGVRKLSGTVYSTDPNFRIERAMPGLNIDGLVMVNTSLSRLGNGQGGANINRLFMLFEGERQAVILMGREGITLANSAFCYRSDNAHPVEEIDEGGSLTPNTIEDCIFDGDGFLPLTDAGDCIIPRDEVTIRRNLHIHQAGTPVTLLSNTAKATIDRITSVSNYWVALGETNGSSEQLVSLTNSLFVNQEGGLGGDSSMVRQASFTLDYNAYWNMSGARNLIHNGATTYLGIPIAEVYRFTTGPGTTETTLYDPDWAIPGSGAQVGDYVLNSAGEVAVVASIGEDHLTLEGDGLAGMAPGETVSIHPSYWSDPTYRYGQPGRGANDQQVDPGFVDPTRTVSTWDAANGGPGTLENAMLEVIKVNGLDANGQAASFNPAYSIDSYLAYIREGYTPTNAALQGAGDGGVDIGAVPVAPA